MSSKADAAVTFPVMFTKDIAEINGTEFVRSRDRQRKVTFL
jgi:hypothetical protein